LNQNTEEYMTSAQIKMLKFAGGNLIVLKRIALNEKYQEYPVQVSNQDVESRNLKISVDSNN